MLKRCFRVYMYVYRRYSNDLLTPLTRLEKTLYNAQELFGGNLTNVGMGVKCLLVSYFARNPMFSSPRVYNSYYMH